MQSSKLKILFRYRQKFAKKDSGNVSTNVYGVVSGPDSTLDSTPVLALCVWANMAFF
jgi:hypothetical protein